MLIRMYSHQIMAMKNKRITQYQFEGFNVLILVCCIQRLILIFTDAWLQQVAFRLIFGQLASAHAHDCFLLISPLGFLHRTIDKKSI